MSPREMASSSSASTRPNISLNVVAWTLDHRGDILNALYTILLGNPRSDCAPQTRFKTWWLLVGSAVENAVLEAAETLLSVGVRDRPVFRVCPVGGQAGV